jgi:hypothetical protein
MDSNGTEIVAGHAGKAAVHLFDQVRAEFKLSLKSLASERDPAARRSCFREVFAIGRADREAQPAADAILICRFTRFYQVQYPVLPVPKIANVAWAIRGSLLYENREPDTDELRIPIRPQYSCVIGCPPAHDRLL